MDVNSGSIHVVDDLVYDIIPLAEALAEKGVKDPAAVKETLGRHEGLACTPEELEIGRAHV